MFLLHSFLQDFHVETLYIAREAFANICVLYKCQEILLFKKILKYYL